MSLPSAARARRVGGLAVLTLGAFALGAPATALAAEDEPLDPGATDRPEGATVTGDVLTPAPLAASTADTGAAHFGWGKLDVDVVVAPGSSFPTGDVLDRTGAQIRVTYSRMGNQDTSDLDAFPDGPPVLECTWDESDADENGNLCDFTGSSEVSYPNGRAVLFSSAAFTIELVTAPASGQVLLPPPAERVVSGYTDGDNEGPTEMSFVAPGAYRTIGVTLTDARGGAVAGATFELCTVAGSTCAPASPSSARLLAAATPVVSAVSTTTGRLVFPGMYLPGAYQIRQTASADGSPFPTAPLTLTLTPAGSPADTTAPVLLPVVLPGATTPAPVTPPAPAPVTTPAPSSPPADGPAPVATPSAAPPGAQPSGTELAATGAAPLTAAVLGVGLVVVGAGVTVAARRRTR